MSLYQRYGGRKRVRVCDCRMCANARHFFLIKYLKNRKKKDIIVSVTHLRNWDSLTAIERLQRVCWNEKMEGWQDDPGPKELR